ncbi:LytR/AlgR family response regulator transcription factor [Niabella insulamsoli]|uniref:LytR/AlgR family response regulator transcription factor n=1 Tax=Niabella insulamsoli TaxID=3144874 RepID=UPI0031FD8FC3
MGIRVQIIEESKAAWDLIKYKIESTSEKKLDILPYCPSLEESVGSLFLYKPDILISDLKVLYSYNLDVIESLFYQNITKPKMIILAAQGQMDGIQRIVEIGIAALVMKPLNADNLARAILRVSSSIEKDKETQATDHFITLKSNRSLLYLNQQDILFIESNRNICTIIQKDGTHKTVNESISSIDQRLLAKELMRIDKSTIINLSKIVYLGGDKYNKECRLKLDNGTEIAKTLSKIAMSRLYKIVANNVKNKGQNDI